MPEEGSHSRQTDSLALVAIFNTTEGANWFRGTNWMSNRPISEWHGVKMPYDSICGELRVSEIFLQSNNLTRLMRFSLGDNELSDLPDSFGSLINLKHLSLNHCGFRTLPECINGLTQLTEIGLRNN